MMTISSGKWAFDSHLLVYSQDPDSRFYKDTLEIFSQVEKANIMAVVTVQNILEAERVFNKVYKKTIKSAARILTEQLSAFNFQILHPLTSTLNLYHELVNKTNAKLDIYDYYLAATLIDNGVNHLLTVNTKDFAAIPGFKAVNPFAK